MPLYTRVTIFVFLIHCQSNTSFVFISCPVKIIILAEIMPKRSYSLAGFEGKISHLSLFSGVQVLLEIY